jgi:hypothetical protein
MAATITPLTPHRALLSSLHQRRRQQGNVMARKPRDFDAELQALMDKAKKVKSQKTVQLGELVQVTGADALPMEALAGALLAAVEQSKKSPEAVARWTERGQAVFQQGGKRGKKAEPSDPAPQPASSNGAA